jgi:hypothetical protein
VLAILVIGSLAIGILLLTADLWGPEWRLSTPTPEPKPPVHRLRRVVGLAIVAAGVSITFLPMSADRNLSVEEWGSEVPHHLECGSAWQAMFSNVNNINGYGYACGRAAFPYLSVAGGIVAVGLLVAFWGAGRGRLLRMMGVALLVPGLLQILGLMTSSNMGGA